MRSYLEMHTHVYVCVYLCWYSHTHMPTDHVMQLSASIDMCPSHTDPLHQTVTTQRLAKQETGTLARAMRTTSSEI